MRIPIYIALAAAGCDGLEAEPAPDDADPTTPVRPDGTYRGTIAGQHGPLEITYHVRNGVPRLGDDMILSWDDFVDPEVAYSGVASRDKRWPAGIVPYVIGGNLPVAEIQAAIAHWEAHTMLRFVPRTSQGDYVRFTTGDGCSSFIGRKGGPQDITLSDSGCGVGVTIHEIGHAAGLYHEQCRSDRDNHVGIFWDNIIDDQKHNFDKYSGSNTDVGPYDFDSIMHYGTFHFSKNGLETIMHVGGIHLQIQRDGLSQGDLSGVEYLYGPPTPPGRTSALDRSNRLNLFARSTSNYLFRNRENTPNGSWSGWQAISTPSGFPQLTSAPVAIRHDDGHLEVFALGTNGGLWTTKESSSGSWSAWTNLSTTPLTGAPSVIRHSDGRLDVFARGADGGLHHIWQTSENGPWSPMVSFGGSLADAPSAEVRPDGRAQVFVVGTDGKLYSMLSGVGGAGWGGYVLHDHPTYTASGVPAVGRNLDGTLSVFVRGGDGKIRLLRQNGSGGATWSWYSAGTTTSTFLGSPTVARNRDGRLEVFAIGADTSVWRVAQAAANSYSWSVWQSFGGTTSTRTPEVAVHDDGRLDVFAIGVGDRAMYSARQTAPSSAWNSWVVVPGTLPIISE